MEFTAAQLRAIEKAIGHQDVQVTVRTRPDKPFGYHDETEVELSATANGRKIRSVQHITIMP